MLAGSRPSWIRSFSTLRFCAAYSRARLSIAAGSILALLILPSSWSAGAGLDGGPAAKRARCPARALFYRNELSREHNLVFRSFLQRSHFDERLLERRYG